MSELTNFLTDTEDEYFGSNVCISADGSTVLIGAYGKNAAYVYTKVLDIWTKNTLLSESTNGLGYSATLSADGKTALIGASIENAAYIYQNIEGTWTQTARLADVKIGYFGNSVSLNADGTVALIGTNGENSHSGAARIYCSVEGTWTETVRLAVDVENSYFGYDVSLNADGTLALIAAPGENHYTGAAYIYQNVSGTWTQIAKISTETASAFFGYRVCLSADGSIALIGAPDENFNNGAVYIYQNVSGTWKLMTRLESGGENGHFGNSVSISADGTVALIAAENENNRSGAVYVYQNVSGIWTQLAKLTSGAESGMFGWSVSLNMDGTIALIGTYRDNSNIADAYIFKNVSGTWTQMTGADAV
jgi:hypothetical protein